MGNLTRVEEMIANSPRFSDGRDLEAELIDAEALTVQQAAEIERLQDTINELSGMDKPLRNQYQARIVELERINIDLAAKLVTTQAELHELRIRVGVRD